ncbi:hypothetical protein HY041_02620 [Candidatus Roizmanbacteria bacterium]|nr:hypothetical protein [Candidatus Roizmanbacteria bacterium]
MMYTTDHMFAQSMTLEAGLYSKFHEFHFTLPRIDKKRAIGILATALIALFVLTSCVSPEGIGANSVLNDCQVTADRLFEGGIISVEGANPDNRIGFDSVATITNPFYVRGAKGKMYYVGYRYDSPRLQFFVPEDMAVKTGACNIETGSAELYDPDSGYLFTTLSRKQFKAGFISVEKRRK